MEEIDIYGDIPDSEEVVLRVATPGDLGAVDDIYSYWIKSECSTADTIPYSQQEREEWFDSHPPETYPVIIAESAGKVAGYFSFSPYRKRREALKYVAEISYFVSPGWIGKGVGTMMMRYGLSIAPGLGFRTLVAILLGHNRASIALLSKFGFKEWGRMPGIVVFDDRCYDHLFYGLKLD
jgi:phosphinothricin acetyltransferase